METRAQTEFLVTAIFGLAYKGRRGVSSTSLKFRTPTCIERKQDAQTRMRMEAGFQVFKFHHCDTKKTAGSELTNRISIGSRRHRPSARNLTATVLRRKGPRCRALRRALASSAPFQEAKSRATDGSDGILKENNRVRGT